MRLRLTGERAIDVADASGTLLFDVHRRSWSEEVAAALEVDAGWLPRSLESPEVSGRTGEDVPVAAGAGDQAAAALGVGVDRPGPLSLVLGTSGVVFAALPGFTPEPQARLHVFCHAVPGTWHAMGVMLSVLPDHPQGARRRRLRGRRLAPHGLLEGDPCPVQAGAAGRNHLHLPQSVERLPQSTHPSERRDEVHVDAGAGVVPESLQCPVGLSDGCVYGGYDPIILLYFFAQRYFIEGITLTGIKG